MKFLTAGESHGKGLLGILDGIPAGLKIEKEYIDIQ
ncbi:chorismate synthase, partial [Candidatus Marinimicrobia bacterium]|nr:chorismate synthase [Candidatus Neomarinimicrobiota bacterium]